MLKKMPRTHKASRHLCSFLKCVHVCNMYVCGLYVCVCVHACVCLRVGLCMPWLACGGQGTLIGAVPHHPIFLRQSLLQWVLARLAGPEACRNSPVSTSHCATAALDCRCSLPCLAFTWVLGAQTQVLGSRGKCFTHWTLSPAPDLCSSQ